MGLLLCIRHQERWDCSDHDGGWHPGRDVWHGLRLPDGEGRECAEDLGNNREEDCSSGFDQTADRDARPGLREIRRQVPTPANHHWWASTAAAGVPATVPAGSRRHPPVKNLKQLKTFGEATACRS